MSKHLGNILEPHPADGPARRRRRPLVHAGRRLAVVGPPGRPRDAVRGRPQGAAHLLEHRQLLHPLRRGQRLGSGTATPPRRRPTARCWTAGRSRSWPQVTADVTAALEDFDTQGAGRLLAGFVDDLSNWYVRRSRRRFWDGDPAALATLHEVLDGLTRLMAPFTPFVTEEVWARAVAPGLRADAAGLGAPRLLAARSTRPPATTSWWPRWRWSGGSSSSAARPGRRPRCAPASRWPARSSPPPAGRSSPATCVAEVADELNVAELVELSAVGELVDVSVKIDFRAVGRRMGKQVQAVAKAVAAADAAELTAAYRAGTATVEVDGAAVPLEDGDLIVTETPREGWTVASGGGLTVALDLTLTPELERAGLAREVVRLVQEARKTSGLDVSDRIELWWTADGRLAAGR